jgi:hypothetical protein
MVGALAALASLVVASCQSTDEVDRGPGERYAETPALSMPVTTSDEDVSRFLGAPDSECKGYLALWSRIRFDYKLLVAVHLLDVLSVAQRDREAERPEEAKIANGHYEYLVQHTPRAKLGLEHILGVPLPDIGP